MLTVFFISTVFMSLTVGAWVFFYMRRSLSAHPSASQGCLTGACGDTMKISLEFDGRRVIRASQQTNGCAHSFTCILAAARLAVGKTPEELFEIDSRTIDNYVGGLPDDHQHCARLAVSTLHSAADDFMKQINRKKGKIS